MKSRVLLSLVAFVVAFAPCRRSEAQWQQAIGPRTGTVSSMAVMGPYIFATTTGRGVFLSSDDGITWTPVNNGLKIASASAITARGQNLFASSVNDVYHSTNLGTTWTKASSGLPDRYIYALAANGTDVFVGTSDSGVYRSTNDGTSWTAVNAGLPSKQVRALAIQGNNLFAATWDSAVYLSTNNGASWSSLGLANQRIYDFAVSGTKLFAGSLRSGVYLSTNEGGSWTQLNTGLTDTLVYALAVSGPNLLAATQRAVFLSTDDGTTWTKVTTDFKMIYVRSLVTKDSVVVAGTDDGTYYSSDHGTTWARSKTGLTYSYVYSLDSAKRDFTTDGALLFAGTHDGLFSSRDTDKSWGGTALSHKDVYAFGSSKLGGAIDRYYAATDTGVYQTTDGGYTWTNWSQGMAISEGHPDFPVRCLMMSGWGVFAGTKESGVFLASPDHPIWTDWNIGLTEMDVRSLIALGSDLFAGTVDGVFRSTNNGGEWMAVGLPNRAVAAFAKSGSNLYAATDFGVFLSTDHAASWTPMNSGLTSLDVHAIVAYGSALFVGTADGNVFLSRNNGNSWRNISEGLECTTVNALMVATSYLHAGTSENGIWRRAISELGLNAVHGEQVTEPVVSVYPNPTTAFATITLTPESSGFVEITIVNLLGQKVAQIYSGVLDASEQTFTWDTRRMPLPRGVYECVVWISGKVQTVPIVVE